MKVSNVKLIVRQKNILEKKEEVIFNGIGQIDTLEDYRIKYIEADNTKVELNVNDEKGFLLRNGEVETKINFNLSSIEECIVTTDLGDLIMQVNTIDIKLEKKAIYLHYKLKQIEAVVGEFQLRLEWENE